MQVTRLTSASTELLTLLQEYYEAVQVVVRDTPAMIDSYAADRNSGVWLARDREETVGCVVLRSLHAIPSAGECKRLYVRPSARGKGVAEALLNAQEDYARSVGLEWIYLDSHDGLQAAIALYRRRGYVDCARYNDNPQATVFLRKRLALSAG